MSTRTPVPGPAAGAVGTGKRVVVIDNYDSFTYNLVHYLAEHGAEVTVRRNDETTVDELAEHDLLVVSPGPGNPDDAGVSVRAIRELTGRMPVLGVCLGHQGIARAFGGRIVRGVPTHGKTSEVAHDGSGPLGGLPNPFGATRYHSLVVDRDSLPDELVATAWTDDGVVMGLRHREQPTFGVQFHPESVLTGVGKRLVANFLEVVP
ncbi:aminodeoxychorismate/anthranilate synthase component II [Actinokineospora sp. PR83]|uniref:anthranilate synthase component II n=1 Tax=Actinokineospora sp. PR83 TaxID=2884908 RepID=UPI001F1FEADC|nr:aminodeoxychorismate/anthranilate synthase component II [Actinokineospora sp. PR83]MCG8917242.1 aminodeoxychorismate/anthranilate synthase component II [Actinokineospora sp. PR83]